jgi:hypothetical protein
MARLGERLRTPVALLVAVLVLFTVPRRLVGRDAAGLYQGDLSLLIPRGDQVAHEVLTGFDATDFDTGDARFNGEWAFGTNQMVVLGLSQIILAHPERADLRTRWLPAIRRSTENLLSPSTRAFGTTAWGNDALDALDDLSSRDAWLGYVALALSMHRLVDPAFPHAEIHDRLIKTLRARIETSATGLFQTYPGETYPVDVSASVGAIALHAKATGGNVTTFVARWVSAMRTRFVDPKSGYLAQSAVGDQAGIPRASGTAFAAYMVGFADRTFAKELFDALRRNGDTELIGFSTIDEYPDGVQGTGDIDSGPVILGASTSGTGFTIASARRFHDRALFTRLHRTATLVGLPFSNGNRKGYAVGGLLGDAILLAMDTAGDLP